MLLASRSIKLDILINISIYPADIYIYQCYPWLCIKTRWTLYSQLGVNTEGRRLLVSILLKSPLCGGQVKLAPPTEPALKKTVMVFVCILIFLFTSVSKFIFAMVKSGSEVVCVSHCSDHMTCYCWRQKDVLSVRFFFPILFRYNKPKGP